MYTHSRVLVVFKRVGLAVQHAVGNDLQELVQDFPIFEIFVQVRNFVVGAAKVTVAPLGECFFLYHLPPTALNRRFIRMVRTGTPWRAIGSCHGSNSDSRANARTPDPLDYSTLRYDGMNDE